MCEEPNFVVQDERYDYNYQQTRFFPKEVNVLPGDELITECDYDTVDRGEFTLVKDIKGGSYNKL